MSKTSRNPSITWNGYHGARLADTGGKKKTTTAREKQNMRVLAELTPAPGVWSAFNGLTPKQQRSSVTRAFARTLKRHRQVSGLSQEFLAVRAGLDRTYPSLLERALRGPSVYAVMALAVALRVQPAQLFDDFTAQLMQEAATTGAGRGRPQGKPTPPPRACR